MGVQGLLPVLKSIQEPTTLEKFRGKTLAIDTYAWLHKASFTCAEDLVLGKPTRAYINYFKKRIEMLKHFNITPYFVFDGDFLPSKGKTEIEREKRRLEYKQLAIEAKKNNNNKLAFSYYQKACDISPEMAKSLINELKIKFIKFIVAPYEADSQMVMLEKLGLVDGIISEDSDLLIFGCKKLITKLDDKGQCIEIQRDNFKNIKGSYINSFNDDQLLLMASISGCDYTKGIPGIGMQKAIQLVKFYKTYERVIMSIKVDGKNIPITFDEEFKRARIAFRHQLVFNPIEGFAQHLNPLTEEILNNYNKEYIHSCTGFILDQEIHRQIANGELNPFSKKILKSWEEKVNNNENNYSTNLRTNSLPIIQNSNNFNNNNFNKNIIKRSNTNINLNNNENGNETIIRKRKSTMRIDQFTNFIKTKKRLNDNDENSKFIDNTTAKRQRILNFNKEIPGNRSIFFSHRKEINKDIINTKSDKEFPATSSDAEDITEEDIDEFNLKLNKSNEIKNKQSINNNKIEESSDINLSESDNENIVNNKNIINEVNEINKSESEFETDDIINSSEISQSTFTMDKMINDGTPLFLNLQDNSISSGISTDPGDINTECYIEDNNDDEEGEDNNNNNNNNNNDGNKFENKKKFDKSNLLDEIYSFKQNKDSKDNKSLFSNDNKLVNNQNYENIYNNNNKKKYRPSPLNQRTALKDVTNLVKKDKKDKENIDNIDNIDNNNKKRANLSSFRYIGN